MAQILNLKPFCQLFPIQFYIEELEGIRSNIQLWKLSLLICFGIPKLTVFLNSKERTQIQFEQNIQNNIICQSSMNPYPNYGYSYPMEGQYNWYHPYYPPTHDYYNCYNSNVYNLPPRSYFPQSEARTHCDNHPAIIKVEEDSQSVAEISNNEAQNKPKKNGLKSLKKKTSQAKTRVENENTYIHPPKIVKHKVKYFDPSAAPVITSDSYNLVEGNLKENERSQMLNALQIKDVNELEYPELDEKPFIVFRFRRIKKKFKKYIKPKDDFILAQKDEESDSQNDQNIQSVSSDSQDNLNHEKSQEKVGKISDDNVEGCQNMTKKTSKTQDS